MSLFTGSLLLEGAAAPGGLSTNYKISKHDDDILWTHEFKQHDCEEPQPAQAVTAQHST